MHVIKQYIQKARQLEVLHAGHLSFSKLFARMFVFVLYAALCVVNAR